MPKNCEPSSTRSPNLDGRTSAGLQTTDVLRRLVHLLAADVPIDNLWAQCCLIVSTFLHARRVTVAIRDAGADRVVFVLDSTRGERPADGAIASTSLLAHTLAQGVGGSDGNAACAVIRSGNVLLGALLIEGGTAYGPGDRTLLEACAAFIGARITGDALRQRTALSASAEHTDPLTGIVNRSGFDHHAGRAWERAVHEHRPIALLALNVDHMGALNAAYGREAGDLCLKELAWVLSSTGHFEPTLFARLDGDTFVALLPDTTLAAAITIAERCREALAQRALANDGSTLGKVSLSIGAVAGVQPEGASLKAFVRSGLAALARAKAAGRNRVVADGYESSSAAVLAARTSSAHNFPFQLTRFVGRETEVTDLCARLDDASLVTILGFGGTGKTRIALEVGTALRDRFEDGTWFLDLGAIGDAAIIPSMIAALFDEQLPESDAAYALARALRDKRALLIFDNCEHLVTDVATLVAILLHGAPRLRILATSREALDLAEEFVYHLPTMTVPPDGIAITAQRAATYSAVALFAERARAFDPTFGLTDEIAPTVAAICRKLDGIALAIELAVPRLEHLSLQELEASLVERLDSLSTASTTVVSRHQTLRALIDGSYELLSDRERAVFRRVSVFAGSFSIEAAIAVCADNDIDRWDVVDIFARLVTKSLVVEDLAAGDQRYHLLESLREYGREKLRATLELDPILRRHATYYHHFAERLNAEYFKLPQRTWQDAMEAEADNFRAAIDWALVGAHDVSLGASLVALTLRYTANAVRSEGQRLAELALRSLEGRSPKIEADILYGLATTLSLLPQQTLDYGERSLVYFRAAGDASKIAMTLAYLSLTLSLYFPERRAAARAMADEAVAVARGLADPRLISTGLRAQARAMARTDLDARHAALREALELGRANPNNRMLTAILNELGELDFLRGNRWAALDSAREALEIAEAVQNTRNRLLAGANIAHYAASLEEWEIAIKSASNTLDRALSRQFPELVTVALHAFAAISAGFDRCEFAARLLGFCDSRFGVVHPPRQQDGCEDIIHGQLLERLERELGRDQLAQALAAGAMLSEAEAVAEARAFALTPRP